VQSPYVAVFLCENGEQKKNANSRSADSGESDPWQAFFVLSVKEKRF
jgi:hypothetical protein